MTRLLVPAAPRRGCESARSDRPLVLPGPPYLSNEVPGIDLESTKERANRQLIELLNEVRVAIPGAQFLFAFLLVVPFSTGFSKVEGSSRYVFPACLLCTLVATILLMGPAVTASLTAITWFLLPTWGRIRPGMDR